MFLDDRKSQVFPTLTPVQLQFALNFASGPARRFSPGEKVFNVGDRHAAVWLVVEGSLVATRHDGLGRESTFTTYGPGQFSGEVSELGEQASLGAASAGPEGCVAYPFDAPHLRALLIGNADIGEMMMRAFILRRAALLEDNGVGLVILGEAGSSDTVRLRGLLSRNGYPHSLIDIHGADGKTLPDRLAVHADDLPLLICPNGMVLKRPTDSQAGIGLGITPDLQSGRQFDVIVVGAGPGGLATAVYAASEGLSVLVLDSRSFGGRRALHHASRTTWAFRPASLATPSQHEPSFRHKSSEPRLPSRSRWCSSTARNPRCIEWSSTVASRSTGGRL